MQPIAVSADFSIRSQNVLTKWSITFGKIEKLTGFFKIAPLKNI